MCEYKSVRLYVYTHTHICVFVCVCIILRVAVMQLAYDFHLVIYDT